MNKVKRSTKFIVYVGEAELDKPELLFQAAMEYLIKKNHPVDRRKKFMALFMKANGKEAQLAVINQWVQLRDVKTFPFRKKTGAETTEETNEDSEIEGGVPVDNGSDDEQESGATSK